MTKADKILIISVIIICLFFLFYLFRFNKDANNIVVKVDGKVVYREKFSKDIITKKIITPYGFNTIEIGEDYVRVIDADCPYKLDVKQGKIKNSGETIICLPHRLIISIEGEGDMPDAITR